ncbi:uncharacterized protein LOC126902997 isoform X2 [Daktulosphaira vitifoliae]|uniref:uncharacterized protein LOC126902997 isoform X2 n=1 Tax=Daktulosphaira vitifoliae TaxID=58002 RepID=UPI0021A9C798|nr:uncharacterized protein LOC126902997 isoform X2 [Daktulosphaira vitifoliae]
MCDQTMPYTPGTLVWVALIRNYWWPGIVIDPEKIPDELKSEIEKPKKKPICTVFFEKERSYHVVYDMKKIYLYDCAKKMEFINYGYTCYKKQNEKNIAGPIKMDNFLDDVISAEKSIGGNLKIFKQVEDQLAKQEKLNVKNLFSSNKKETRRSLPVPVVSQIKKKLSTPRSRPVVPSSTIPGVYFCHLKMGCTFSSTRFENLKRHMAMHKTENNLSSSVTPMKDNSTSITSKSSTKIIFSSPKKRKLVKTKKPECKKMKIHNEILKDWDDDDEDNELYLSNEEKKNYCNDTESNGDIFEKVKQLTPQKNDEDEIPESNISKTVLGSPNVSKVYSEKKLENYEKSFLSKGDSSDIEKEMFDDINNTKLLLEKTENTLNYINNLESSIGGKLDKTNSSDPVNAMEEIENKDLAVGVKNRLNNVETNQTKVNTSNDTIIVKSPTPDWVIEEKWNIKSDTGFNEVESFLTLPTLESHLQKMKLTAVFTDPIQAPIVTAEIQPEIPPNTIRRTIRMPVYNEVEMFTDKELLEKPEIQKLRNYLKQEPGTKLFVDIEPRTPNEPKQFSVEKNK